MRRTAFALAGLLAAGTLVVSSCGEVGDQPNRSTAKRDTGIQAVRPSPREALSLLLNRVTKDDAFRRTGFRSGARVTRGFVDSVDFYVARAEAAGAHLDIDPFLCTQNVPYSIRYTHQAIDGSIARVHATLEFDGPTDTAGPTYRRAWHHRTYILKLEDGVWKLDRTHCMPGGNGMNADGSNPAR